jgi:hypothetical protein
MAPSTHTPTLTLQVGREVGWYFKRQAQLASAHAVVEVGVALQRCLLKKVG